MSTNNAAPGISVLVLTCALTPPARRQSAERQCAGLPAGARVRFIEGCTPADAEAMSLFDAGANRWSMNRKLADAEVAAYATHRLAWRELLESGDEFALVVEDDFEIVDKPALTQALANADALCDGRDIIKLFDFPRRKPGVLAERVTAGGVDLVKWRYPSTGTVAYLITRRGAEKLLTRRKVFRPVDEDMKYFWELDLDVWSAASAPIVEVSASLGGSLIEGERQAAKSRKLGDRLRGNLIRLKWRTQCYWRNRRA